MQVFKGAKKKENVFQTAMDRWKGTAEREIYQKNTTQLKCVLIELNFQNLKFVDSM